MEYEEITIFCSSWNREISIDYCAILCSCTQRRYCKDYICALSCEKPNWDRSAARNDEELSQ
jgi:hypothetical protein